MNKIDKIKSIVKRHQKEMDKHFAAYKKAELIARERLSESAFKTEFMIETYPKMAGEARSAADMAVLDVNNIFNDIKEDLAEWMMKPIDAGTAQVLDCINKFGLHMSFDELRILEQGILKAGSYLGNRVFDGVCQKNGYLTSRPDLKKMTDALEHARESTELAVMAYAGKMDESGRFPGCDLLGEWMYNGISYGQYRDYHLYDAEHFLHEGGILDNLSCLLESANAPMKYILDKRETEKMTKSLEKIVDKNGEIDASAALQLKESDPDFINKLRSMPDNSFKDMDVVTDFFRLDERGDKKKESALSPAMEQAAQYKSVHGAIDADANILNRY